MLDAGADPTVCDALGETVLMKAMRNEHQDRSDMFISKVIESMFKRTLPVSHATPRLDTHSEAVSGVSTPQEARGKRRRT
jgi:ankyrin repeat protein